MTDKVVMYVIYLALSIALTIWVAGHATAVLQDAFDDERLATSVNQPWSSASIC